MHTDQVGSKWEAFAADMRASRGSCEETAQLASEPAPEDLKTPQAAKFRAESPGPVPMSGLSYSGACLFGVCVWRVKPNRFCSRQAHERGLFQAQEREASGEDVTERLLLRLLC